MTKQMDAVHEILIDVDIVLQERLAAIGVKIAHIILAIGPVGDAIVHGNVDTDGLRQMGAELIMIADNEERRRPENEPLN